MEDPLKEKFNLVALQEIDKIINVQPKCQRNLRVFMSGHARWILDEACVEARIVRIRTETHEFQDAVNLVKPVPGRSG